MKKKIINLLSKKNRQPYRKYFTYTNHPINDTKRSPRDSVFFYFFFSIRDVIENGNGRPLMARRNFNIILFVSKHCSTLSVTAVYYR